MLALIGVLILYHSRVNFYMHSICRICRAGRARCFRRARRVRRASCAVDLLTTAEVAGAELLSRYHCRVHLHRNGGAGIQGCRCRGARGTGVQGCSGTRCTEGWGAAQRDELLGHMLPRGWVIKAGVLKREGREGHQRGMYLLCISHLLRRCQGRRGVGRRGVLSREPEREREREREPRRLEPL